jgi:cytochrome P450
MVSANSDEASAFTDDEIAGNILIMFLAGEDTTAANTLAWMMHLMAEHPEVQCQLQAEAHQVLGEAERSPTFESTSALRYREP